MRGPLKAYEPICLDRTKAGKRTGKNRAIGNEQQNKYPERVMYDNGITVEERKTEETRQLD